MQSALSQSNDMFMSCDTKWDVYTKNKSVTIVNARSQIVIYRRVCRMNS